MISSKINPLRDPPALPGKQYEFDKSWILLFPGPDNNQEDKHWNIECRISNIEPQHTHFEIHHSLFEILRFQNIYSA